MVVFCVHLVVFGVVDFGVNGVVSGVDGDVTASRNIHIKPKSLKVYRCLKVGMVKCIPINSIVVPTSSKELCSARIRFTFV